MCICIPSMKFLCLSVSLSEPNHIYRQNRLPGWQPAYWGKKTQLFSKLFPYFYAVTRMSATIRQVGSVRMYDVFKTLTAFLSCRLRMMTRTIARI